MKRWLALALFLVAGGVAAQDTHTHTVPLFFAASDETREGYLRIINRSEVPGVVFIHATDDAGRNADVATLAVAARGVAELTSVDLERGNAGKGLPGRIGSGLGDWRLQLGSDLDIVVLAYVRVHATGYVTRIDDVVAGVGPLRWHVPVFKPASNTEQVSHLRLVNHAGMDATVTVTGVDDGGNKSSTVSLDLAAGRAATLTASDLESGVGLDGALGDGDGQWRLEVTSDTPLSVMNLLTDHAGHVANLSAVPRGPEPDGRHMVPLFPSASDPYGRQGVVRVINRSDEAGQVRIQANDDTDTVYGALTLAIGGGEAVQFDSDDLESGNPTRGLVGATGAGTGDWRLELSSTLDIQVLPHVRAADGFLTSMHGVATSAGSDDILVRLLNPARSDSQASMLRLINASDAGAEVVVKGVDDRGARAVGDEVRLHLPAGAARTYSLRELEDGHPDLVGHLGAGSGRWQLAVAADQPIRAMGLLSTPAGHLVNLSSVAARHQEPARHDVPGEPLELRKGPTIRQASNGSNAEADTASGNSSQEGSLRLVGGNSALEGRVEVFLNGQWGTVCDDLWGRDDAAVACRQLGHLGGTPHSRAHFGAGSGPIWLDNVECEGNEARLVDCRYDSTHNCYHREDAGVTCSGASSNNPPTFSTAAAQSVPENTTPVVTLAANDPDGDAVTFSVTGGADQNLFALDGAQLAFRSPPDYEDAEDANEDNVYEVTVQAADTNGGTASLALRISVTNVVIETTQASTIRLVGGGSALEGRVEVFQNGRWGTVCDDLWGRADAVVACRQAGHHGGIAYSRAYFGAGSGPILLDNVGCRGNEARLVDCWYDSTPNCLHWEDASVSCAANPAASNNAPTFDTSASQSVPENTTAVVTLAASDADGDPVKFSITGGADQSRFQLGGRVHHHAAPLAGRLAFRSAPDHEDPRDRNDDNVYEVTLQAEDAHGDAATLHMRVTVTDVAEGPPPNQAPVFSTAAAQSVPENTTAVVTLAADDADGDTVTFSITGGADQDRFELAGAELAFASAPDYETTSDANNDNVYEVLVQAADGRGGTASLQVHVTVTNVDEGGEYASTIRLVGGDSTLEGRVEVLLDGQWGTVCDDLWGPTDAAVACRQLGHHGGIPHTRAYFGAGSGPILLDNVFCRGDEMRLVDCTYDDTHNCFHYEDASVSCAANPADSNNAPTFDTVAEHSVAENTTEVVTLAATDPDGDPVTFSITGGDDVERFALGARVPQHAAPFAGRLAFRSGRDHEDPTDADEDNVYEVTVQVADAHGAAATLELRVTVTDVNEPPPPNRAPVFGTAAEQNVAENTTAVVTLAADDADGDAVAFSITGGADQDRFSLDDDQLSFLSAPDYETATDSDNDNVYEVTLKAADGRGGTASLQMRVTVTDVADEGSYTSTIRLVGGNSALEGRVEVFLNGQWGTVCDDLWEPADAAVACRQLGHQGGTPHSRAHFGQGSGPIWLDNVGCTGNEARLIDCPYDSTPNCYHREDAGVTCTANPASDNNAPIFDTTADQSIVENATAVVTLAADDADGDAVTFSITGGADRGHFELSGADLAFGSAPDYEVPDDANQDNVYEVTVQAVDTHGAAATLHLRVAVTDEDEWPPPTAFAVTITGPESHSGEPFEVEVLFHNVEPRMSGRKLGNYVVDLSGGSWSEAITNGHRKHPSIGVGRNLAWVLPVTPDGAGPVSIAITATGNCPANYAGSDYGTSPDVCSRFTPIRALEAGFEITIPVGPATGTSNRED